MKKNPEFDNFTGFMDKLAKVPHSELKAKLDAEKQTKQSVARPDKKVRRTRVGSQVKAPHIALLVALTILCIPAMSHAAKHEVVWQSAKLLSYGTQQVTDSGTAETTGHANSDGTYSGTTTESDSSYVDCHIVLDDGKMLYFGSWRLAFRWQHSAHFTENEIVKFDLDGDKLTVLDDTGKQIKMKLTKRRIKE